MVVCTELRVVLTQGAHIDGVFACGWMGNSRGIEHDLNQTVAKILVLRNEAVLNLVLGVDEHRTELLTRRDTVL